MIPSTVFSPFRAWRSDGCECYDLDGSGSPMPGSGEIAAGFLSGRCTCFLIIHVTQIDE